MSLIERGVHKPHAQTLGRIAHALDMSVAELRAELEAAEHPLAEAPPSSQPTLNGALEELRRTVERNEAAVALDEFREQIAKRLAAGELDRAIIEETGRAISAVWPALLLAVDAEAREVMEMHGGEPQAASDLAVLRAAVERFVDFSDQVNRAYREMLREAAKARKTPESNVFALRLRRAS